MCPGTLCPGTLKQPLSQQWHLARWGWGGVVGRSASVLRPASNSMQLSEVPLFLTEPWFPCLSRGEVSLEAVLWPGAELAGKSPTSCGWSESLFLWVADGCGTQGKPLGKEKGAGVRKERAVEKFGPYRYLGPIVMMVATTYHDPSPTRLFSYDACYS